MELKMNEYQLPEKILFNYEELKQELTKKASMYETLVYTDDQIKEAKADKANLNKLKKALNDERIRREKEYMIPFNDFKSKINEIIGIIDKPIQVIDSQVKEYEDKKKEEKLEAIKSYWRELLMAKKVPEGIGFNQIFEDRWLNASITLSKVKKELEEKLVDIAEAMQMLSNLPEFGFEAVQVYKTTLDVNKAVNEAQRMAQIAKAKEERQAALERAKAEAEERAKAEAEERAKEDARRKAEIEAKANQQHEEDESIPGQVSFNNNESFEKVVQEAKAPERTWLTFRANLTTEDAFALKAFFESRNIPFERA